MANRTKSGRTKNVKCPYCDGMFYSINTANMHIASKHPGKATLVKGSPKTENNIKPFNKEEPRKETQAPTPQPQQESDPYD